MSTGQRNKANADALRAILFIHGVDICEQGGIWLLDDKLHFNPATQEYAFGPKLHGDVHSLPVEEVASLFLGMLEHSPRHLQATPEPILHPCGTCSRLTPRTCSACGAPCCDAHSTPPAGLLDDTLRLGHKCGCSAADLLRGQVA